MPSEKPRSSLALRPASSLQPNSATAAADWAGLDERLRAAKASVAPSDAGLLELDPAAASAAAAATALKATPDNTLRSYRAAHQYLVAWHRVRLDRPYGLPWSPITFATFLFDHYPHYATMSDDTVLPAGLPSHLDQLLVDAGVKARCGQLALATLAHRIAFLAKSHRLANIVSPTDDPQIRTLMKSVRRLAMAKQAPPRKADAITRPELKRMLDTCDDSLIGVRDRALLLFGWASGGRRRSEIAAADWSRLISRGPNSYDYLLLTTKTNKDVEARPSDYKPLRGSAAAALSAWLSLVESAGFTSSSGPIFRMIGRAGHITAAGLSDQAINRIVKHRANLAGLKGRFSAHSLRAGFVTQSHLSNIATPDAMARSGHASRKVFDGYFRVDPTRGDPVDTLFDVEG